MNYAVVSGRFRGGRLYKACVAGVKRRFCRAAVAVAVIGCLGISAAFADTNVLPDPTWNGGLQGNGEWQIYGPGEYTLPATQEGLGAANAQLSAEPFPWLSASAGPAAKAISELDYFVEIAGPTPNVLVDVSGLAKGAAVYTGSPAEHYAQATSWLMVDGRNIVLEEVGADGNAAYNIQFNQSVLLPTGSPIEVFMDANAYSDTALASASAYLDPYFSIDPSNADAGAYSILTSPGIGNSPSAGVPGTPEPSTWAMMMLGFAGLGFAGLRRHRSPVAH